MSWLVAFLVAVSNDPQVRRAVRVLLRALLLAAATALGLGALLPPGTLPSGL